MNTFLPPVLFEIQANATQALATFKKVNTELTIMEAKALKAGAALTKFQIIGAKAVAVFKGLSIAVAAFGAIGVHEFMQLEQSMIQLGQAMTNAGVNTAENRKQVESLLSKYEELGFDAANMAAGYRTLLQATQDVNKANHMLGTALDLARAKHMSIEEASLALARASAGNARIFTQFGITLDRTKPKAEATAEAMAKLEARLGGQAQAYTKTFAGQLAILQVKIQNIAEAFGSVLVPALNKFLSGIQSTFSWIGKNAAAFAAIAALITTVVVVAVVTLTKKLYAQATAWAIANWQMSLSIAAVVALVAGFVKLWNTYEGFRKAVVYGMKTVTATFIGFVEIVRLAYNAVSLLARGMANLIIAWGKLRGDESSQKTGKQILDWIDSGAKAIEDFNNKLKTAYKNLDTLQDKKITMAFKLPSLASLIPDFGKGTAFDEGTDGANKLSDALINARQRFIDFATTVADWGNKLKTSLMNIAGKDWQQQVEDGLLAPVDKLIKKTNDAIASFNAASADYASAMSQLTAAQKAYESAVQGTDKSLIASTESALKRAEDIADSLMGTMTQSAEQIAQLQDEMISAVIDSYNEIADLRRQRQEVIDAANADEARLTKDHLKDLANLRAEYEKKVAEAQVESAKRTAEIIKQSVDQLRGIYRNATQRGIGEIFSSLTFEGRYLKGGSISAITNALGLQLTKAKTLADDAAKLGGLGFSQTFIEQVVAQGPEVGHQLAQTIIKGTPESITKLQDYWKQLESQTQHGVDALADKLNSGVTLATEELTAQLAQVGKDLTAQLQSYESEFMVATTDAVATYKDALQAIQDATAKKIAEIDGQIATLMSRIEQLKAALFALGQIPTGTGSGGSYVPPTIVPIPTSPSMTQAEQDRDIADSDARLRAFAANRTTSVVVQAQTNADPQQIATDVAWAIRTSGDLSYAINPKTNKRIPMGAL